MNNYLFILQLYLFFFLQIILVEIIDLLMIMMMMIIFINMYSNSMIPIVQNRIFLLYHRIVNMKLNQ